MKILLLILFPVVASAQTYDLNIAMDGPTSMNFTGSFEFDPGASCSGSALFCSGKPKYSDVSVSDGFDGGTFTEAQMSYGQMTLYDFEGLPESPDSSLKFSLVFDVRPSFGGRAPYLSDIYLDVDGNSTGMYRCGQNAPGFVPITCTASLTRVASAPEVDPNGAISMLTFLAGSLAVMRARRRRGNFALDSVSL